MANTAAKPEKASLILARGVAGALKPFIWGAVVYGCVSSVADAFKAYAGKISLADMNFLTGVFANGYFSMSITVAVTGCGWLYGLLQWMLRRKVIKRLQTRIIDLESKLDSRRTSSQLTPEGLTRKDDR